MSDTNVTPPKVYIANFAGHDFSAARKFGEFVVMFPGYVNMEKPDRVLYRAVELLKTSQPTDYFCPSGLLLLNIIIAIAWLTKHHSLRMLAWRKIEGIGTTYEEVTFTLDQVETLIGVLDSVIPPEED